MRKLSSAAATGGFRVLGLQQIAIGSLNLDKLSALWEGEFQIPCVGTYASESENVDERILKLGRGATAVEVDLMTPLDASKSPKVHVPALNHIGLWVDSIVDAYAVLEQRGVRFAPGGIRAGAAGHDVRILYTVGVHQLVPKPYDCVLCFFTNFRRCASFTRKVTKVSR